MTKPLTLIYQGAHQSVPTEETFASERELCQRVVDIARDWDQVNFYLAQPDGKTPVWLSAEDIAARLALINARRDALALTLLCQVNGIWTDRLARIPDLEMAKRVMDTIPSLREAIYFDADRLIAAYEGAKP